MTELTPQSIAVGSLKEQKGHSYLISLRKPKPVAERALSVTVAGPPSVLDYFLTPQSPAHIQHFPEPTTEPASTLADTVSLSLGIPVSPS